MKLPSPMTEAEEIVMLALWQAGPGAARWKIARCLPPEIQWKESTLLNFLYRLEEKGWVTGAKQGNKNVYTPTVSRRRYAAASIRQRVDLLFGGSLEEMADALLEEGMMDAADLERVRNALSRKIDAAIDYDIYDPWNG